MNSFDRREFLGAGFGSLATLGAASAFADDDDKPKKKSKKKAALKAAADAKAAEKKPEPTIVPPGIEETVFLTWQRDPTTTMTVQWICRAKDAPNSNVSFRTHSGGLWHVKPAIAKPYPMTELQVFRAELDGLVSGTEYEFRVGDLQKAHRFRTMPAKATNAFHFVTGGDSGIDQHAIANNKIAAKQDPMFAVIGGDIAYENGRSPSVHLQFVRNYTKHMIDGKGRMIPLVVCLGNHEVDGGYGKPREKAPFFFALFDGLYANQSYATLDFGDYLSLVLLDTAHISPIEGEQTLWLERVLRERLDKPHVFAINHVPAYPSFRRIEDNEQGAGTGAGNRKHWVPLFEKYNIDVVLEHHDHTFKRTHPLKNGLADKNGILYLGDGSWGKLRPPKSPEERPYLAVTAGSYHLTLHRLEGEIRYHMAIEETGRIIDICSTTKKPRRAPPA